MDPIKKAAVVVNEYMTDFLDTVNQFPTKDMDVVRQVVGQWPLVKKLLNSFVQECLKDGELNPQYVKTVAESFKQSAALLDKLETLYKNVTTFDLDGIKTHTEPLLKLIERSKGDQGSPEAQPTEDEGVTPPEDMGDQDTEELKKMASAIVSELDKIADELQKEEPLVAVALDRISDCIDPERV